MNQGIFFEKALGVTLLAVLFAQFALAAPELPHLFYGSANVNGAAVPSGATIIAQDGSTEVGRITLTEAGKYGGPSLSDQKLLVQGDIADEATIQFLLSGVAADQTAAFQSGNVDELDLTWNFPAQINLECPLIDYPVFVVPGSQIVIACGDLTLTLSADSPTFATINDVSSRNRTTAPSTAALGTGFTVLTLFEISITGDIDATATLQYTDNSAVDEGSIAAYKYKDGAWVKLNSVRDQSANTITFDLIPGSLYGAIGGPTSGGSGQIGGGAGNRGAGTGGAGGTGGTGTGTGTGAAGAGTAGGSAAGTGAGAAGGEGGAGAGAGAGEAGAAAGTGEAGGLGGVTGAATAAGPEGGLGGITGAVVGAFKSPFMGGSLGILLLGAIILLITLVMRRSKKGKKGSA